MSGSSSSSSNSSNDEEYHTTTGHSAGQQQQSNQYAEISIDKSPSLEREQQQDKQPSPLSSFTVDHTYLRSIEGILRLASVPVAILFLALDLIGYKGPGGWINMFIAVGWLLYAAVTITVEVSVAGINVHRLADGIICIVWSVVWGVACIIAIVSAAVHSSTVLGAAAFFSIVMIVLVSVNGLFALRTWRTYEGGTKGSQPIFVM